MSKIPTIVFAIDISKSMDEKLGYLEKKIELAKQIFLKLSKILFDIIGQYRLYLYVFPTIIPDVMPCENLYRITILDRYSLASIDQMASKIPGIRSTTPLIEALTMIARQIEKESIIITITDGEIPTLAKEKINELVEVVDNKNIRIYILVLSTKFVNLTKTLIKTDKITIERLYPSSLYSLIIEDTLKIIAYQIANQIKQKIS